MDIEYRAYREFRSEIENRGAAHAWSKKNPETIFAD